MLRKEKEDIFKASYEIEIYVNLYEIFMADIENLEADILRGLLNLKSGIMAHIYQEWLSREDSFFEELRSYACDELRFISESENPDCREEGEDGAGSDKAAKGRGD